MEAAQLSARNSLTSTLVSAPSRKPGVFVLLGVSACLGLLVAGYAYPQWAAGYGPGFARIFDSPASPIIAWVNTLLLFSAAQAAWVVSWERSRRRHESAGPHRIWGWAAMTWLMFSLASATQAHIAWSETILHHIRWRTPGAMLWCWLLPAAAWGWGLFLRLEPELRPSRSGHWLLLTAGAWYLGIVGLLCQREFWPQACAPELSRLLLAALPSLGHASLLLSMTLLARHILSGTTESPVARRRMRVKTVDRTSAKPSWLRPAWLFRSRRASAEEGVDGDDKPQRGQKRATATRKRATPRKATRAAKSTGDEAPEINWESAGSGEASGQNFRFDDAEAPQGAHFGASADEDSDELKGLSKRDRRKLQQQMREQERRDGR